MTNRIRDYLNNDNENNNENEKNMPTFEEYQEFFAKFNQKMNTVAKYSRFMFWFGVVCFWLVVTVLSAYAVRFLLLSLSFLPESINIEYLDVLKVYGIFAFIFLVKRLFPLE